MDSHIEETSFEDAGLPPFDGSSHTESITAVIPAYNEEITIDAIVRMAMLHAREVIVVDDGSKDRTGELAALAGATVIRIPRNSGKGHALGIGLSTAAMNGCSIVVCLDADGQHDPADIPRVAQPIIDGKADMVIGSRYLNQNSKHQIPMYRRIGQNILTTATNFRNAVRITDSQSGYRAFTKDIVNSFSYSEAGMGIESEMIRNAVNSGARIQEVPILAKYENLRAPTRNPGFHGMAVLKSVIRLVGSERPLLYLGVSGFLLALMGSVIGVLAVFHYNRFDSLPLGQTILSVLMIVIGTLFALVGLILNAISQAAPKIEES